MKDIFIEIRRTNKKPNWYAISNAMCDAAIKTSLAFEKLRKSFVNLTLTQ